MVKTLLTATIWTIFGWASAHAFGQESAPVALRLDEPVERPLFEAPEQADLPLPTGLSFEETAEPVRATPGRGFVIGPMAGYLRARGDDHGAWFGGVVARAYIFPALAAEGSISVHQDKFADGDVRVTQWPVQVSGLLFPFHDIPIDPYVVAGAGWYYTRVHTRGSKASFRDETDNSFGVHAGAGLELRPSAPVMIFADVRYIFIRPTTDSVAKADFSFWQVTLGVAFGF